MPSYSKTRVFLHWLIALLIIGLFASGFWMVELDYYDEWYTKAPFLHKSIGMLLLVIMAIAFIIRLRTAKPPYEETLTDLEKRSAKLVQLSMSVLSFFIIVTGYLLVTANGDSMSFFNWFDIPATISDIKNQEDISGKLHKWAAYILIGLACLHAGAALFHHFIKKDRTLSKMLGR